ncbi:uncharacterized protein I303_106068 [Kwoniella dejecticola CBS 10117]|uniref:GH18 domain-containing protein n=1 Tax=Kwoniella dejecticola CBS 10117 TaxID=1296121 RepID=A0AAJ8KTA0_9TREE
MRYLFTTFICLLPFIPRPGSAGVLAPHLEKPGCVSCGGSGSKWSGYRNVGYFTNWEADIQYEYPGDNLDEEGNNLYGNLKQLYLLKKQNRHLKTLLSIGGWTYSPNFANITDAKWRETFVNTSVSIVNNYGFDGLDIDFVLPDPAHLFGINSPEGKQGKALTELLRCLREALDQAAKANGGGHYELTAAVGCGVTGWHGLDVSGMDKYLDFWNLMAYDTPTALPASNLYHDPNPANDQNASGHECVQHYAGEGVNSRKLVLGMPLYGTAFNGTQGLWTNWTDIGGGDYDQPGNYDDKHLPLEGAIMFYNKSLGASWSYDNSTGHVVSFDTPAVALQKAKYIMKNQLGGMMYWSIDQDYTRLQDTDKPVERIWPGGWDRLRGTSKKVNFGPWKGSPWPVPDDVRHQHGKQKRSLAPSVHAQDTKPIKRVNAPHTERAMGNWHDWAGWGEWEDLKQWKLKLDDDICLNIGYSLIDTVKTAFEKYGEGLDRSNNNLNYPNSVYDNIRSGLP